MSDMETIARKTLAAINPNLTVVKFQTFNEQISDRFTEERMVQRLTVLFGGLALLLAAIGLYGITAYSVVRRTSEIGIRMALGAERLSVITMILRSAFLQMGLVIEIPVALLSVRFVKTQLYEIKSADWYVTLGAIVTLAIAACVAGIIPARRAVTIFRFGCPCRNDCRSGSRTGWGGTKPWNDSEPRRFAMQADQEARPGREVASLL